MPKQQNEMSFTKEMDDMLNLMSELMKLIKKSMDEKRRISAKEFNEISEKLSLVNEKKEKLTKETEAPVFKESLRDIFKDEEQARMVMAAINEQKNIKTADPRNRDYFNVLKSVEKDPKVSALARENFRDTGNNQSPLRSIRETFTDGNLSGAVFDELNAQKRRIENSPKTIEALYKGAGYQPFEKDLRKLTKPVRSIDDPVTQDELDLIRKLDLSSLGIKDLSGIERLRNLENLNLSDNGLKAVPKEISNLEYLKQLDLSGNQLTSLPREMGYLRQLESLDLSSNAFKNTPEILSTYQSLKVDLRENPLVNEKTSPREVNNNKELESIDYQKTKHLEQTKKQTKESYLDAMFGKAVPTVGYEPDLNPQNGSMESSNRNERMGLRTSGAAKDELEKDVYTGIGEIDDDLERAELYSSDPDSDVITEPTPQDYEEYEQEY